jgi:hypothetical protein
MPICLNGAIGGTKSLGEESAPEFQVLPRDSDEPLGIETGVDCCRILLGEPHNTRLVHTEQHELVLVEANRDHWGAALGDALPGKQGHKDIRGRARSLPEKVN